MNENAINELKTKLVGYARSMPLVNAYRKQMRMTPPGLMMELDEAYKRLSKDI